MIRTRTGCAGPIRNPVLAAIKDCVGLETTAAVMKSGPGMVFPALGGGAATGSATIALPRGAGGNAFGCLMPPIGGLCDPIARVRSSGFSLINPVGVTLSSAAPTPFSSSYSRSDDSSILLLLAIARLPFDARRNFKRGNQFEEDPTLRPLGILPCDSPIDIRYGTPLPRDSGSNW